MLWAWGYNNRGQLGDDSRTNRSIPVRVGDGTDWITVVAGSFSGMGIRGTGERGTLWAWGDRTNGRLGLGDDALSGNQLTPVQVGTADDWFSVSGGMGENGFGMGMREAGNGGYNLWAWGLNTSGQLGDNSTTQRNSPVQVQR